MNDFLDKLGYAAKRAAKTVASEVNMAAQKQLLSDYYRDLGKLYYQAMKRGEAPDFPAEVARIDALLDHIATLKDRRNVTDVQTEPEAEESDFVIVEEE